MTEAPAPTHRAAALQRFIPFRRRAILDMLCKDGRLPKQEQQRLRDLAGIIEAYYHFLFHRKLEELKDAYFPFDPDIDVKVTRDFSTTDLARHGQRLVKMLVEVLNDANFEEIKRAEIEESLKQKCLFRMRLKIDFDDFEECLVFARGNVIKRKSFKKFFFRKRERDVPTYERVVIFIRFQKEDHFRPKRPQDLNFDPGSTIIKQFKDIAHSDLEMLFPNTELVMRMFDKLLLGIPAIGGIVPILIMKVLPHLPLLFSVLLAFFAGRELSQKEYMSALLQGVLAFGVLGGYCWRQWEKFRHRRIQYLQTLTENLYFRNLNNNSSVFYDIIDKAEEEEFKEALLAYYFLLTDGPEEPRKLDQRIERWFREQHQTPLDFEVNGGLKKLQAMGIGTTEETAWKVLPLPQALQHLDTIWDGFFDYQSLPRDSIGSQEAPPRSS